jgi:hypothetical protein
VPNYQAKARHVASAFSLFFERFLRFFYTSQSILNNTFTPRKPNSVHQFEQEVQYGYGICRVGSGPLVDLGANDLGAYQTGKAAG